MEILKYKFFEIKVIWVYKYKPVNLIKTLLFLKNKSFFFLDLADKNRALEHIFNL